MEPTDKLEWEPPTAIPLTDGEGRADQADIWMENANSVPPTS